MSAPLLYETHMHTPLCRHAQGEPEEYAARAEARGLQGIVVTCHNPLPGNVAQASRMYPTQWLEYIALVQRAREAWAGRIDVRLGLEADFFPGMEGFLREQLASVELHHVLGSVHPFLDEYRQMFWMGDLTAFFKGYFTNLAKAAETGLFDTISHPDLVKNMAPNDWDLNAISGHVDQCLDRIAATGVAMELNTSGLLKPLPEYNPSDEILRRMRARNIPCVIGADAHVPKRVADRFEDALDHLAAAGYTHVSYFLERQRVDVEIGAAKASLRAG